MAKIMLIDDLCMVGSTNMNHRSFYHDLELDIVLGKPESIQTIKANLQNDILRSRLITLKDLERSSLKLFAARFLRIFRYWL